MAFDPFLAARVRRMLAADPGITEQRMFGGLAFLRHGLMVMAVMDGRVLARVGAEGYAAALANSTAALAGDVTVMKLLLEQDARLLPRRQPWSERGARAHVGDRDGRESWCRRCPVWQKKP